MSNSFVNTKSLPAAPFLQRSLAHGGLVTFDIDITPRCNNDCRHCYINVPASDREAKAKELTLDEIDSIAEQAKAMGALQCLVTGGEPLLREDFEDIYLALKRKGFFVRLFTNANLITRNHIKLLQRYPPKEVEVTIYGATEKTYEAITRRPGSFATFMRGVSLLLDGGIPVRFKAMAIRSNVHELRQITEFGMERTKDYFRFDPVLHLRYDGDPARNDEIRAERLSPEQVTAAERADPLRFELLSSECANMLTDGGEGWEDNRIFRCGAGVNSCSIAYDGTFRLCSCLRHPDCILDLRKTSLADAYLSLVSKVRNTTSSRQTYLERCGQCSIPNFCLWCPGNAYLECGELDMPIDYYCEVAHARARMLQIDSKYLQHPDGYPGSNQVLE